MAAGAVLYAASVALRAFLTSAPGYVHPDEVFQSTELAAADVFGYDAFVPWEVADCATPYRSSIAQ